MSGFTLTDGLLVADGVVLGIAVGSDSMLASTIAGIGFAFGVIAKSAETSAEVRSAVDEAQQAPPCLTWIERQAARPMLAWSRNL